MEKDELYLTSDGRKFSNAEDEGDSSEELARDRTRLALLRTVLANERSFSAWVRTGISAELGGLAVAKLLPDFSPEWVPTAVGYLFLAVGLACFIYGIWRYRSRMMRLVSMEEGALKNVSFWALIAVLFGSAALIGVTLWIK